VTTCTAPGCGQTAVLQWQRDATDLEADHAVQVHAGTQTRIHKHQVAAATSHLIQTRRQHQDAGDAAAQGDHRAQAILTTLAANIDTPRPPSTSSSRTAPPPSPTPAP
jgi:hypothetical protein